MKRFALGVLSLLLTLLSGAFLLVALTMDPYPPEWSREAAEMETGEILAGYAFGILAIATWIGTAVSWKKLLKL